MFTQTQTQTQVIVTELASKLQASDRLTQSVVAKIMSRTFGGGAATGKWNWKQATDLIEGAVVTLLLTGKYQYLEDYTNLQALIPHHQVRSQEQV
jgi:hypothetical protein